MERYRLLVDAITDYAIYMLDADGIVTSWNPGAERFKGYNPREIIGQHFSVFYTDEDRASALPDLALKTAATEGRFEREGWRVRKDGTQFWAHVIIDPIRTPAGHLVGYAKVTRDLTERRAAEESLRQSEEQFRRLIQGVIDYAIYMLDREGHVSSWNAGAQRIKGYTPNEAIGRHVSSFYTPEDRAAGTPQKGLATAAREGRWEHEGWRVRKDGSRFWAHAVIDAIRDPSGEVIGFAKVTRDITERREAQRILDETRDALFQSQKLDAIGQLTGGVAHDFNNLLSAILGSLELVKKRVPFDPRISPLIDNAIQGAQRGATLTQRMLAFARKQELHLEAVDLTRLAQGMIGFLERTIGPSVRIETRFPPNLPLVRTDPNQVESAILNLVVNARDALPDGGLITITADARRLAEMGGSPMVCLSVTDTGQGMDEETVARALEPFFTTKGVGKGTGLGLSMVHGLAVQSGGSLKIKSKLKEGTTVELILPVSDETEARAADAPSGPTAAVGSKVILAVDDDVLVLMNTVALLQDLGHEALEAISAVEALEIVRERPDIEVLITDQAMPGMTGVQLREALRATRPDLRVIIATGYAELPTGSARDFVQLAKPFVQAELAAAIELAVRVPVEV